MILKRNFVLFNLSPASIISTILIVVSTATIALAQRVEKSNDQSGAKNVAATPTPTPSPASAIKPTSTTTSSNSTANTSAPNASISFPQEPDPIVVLTAPTPTPTPTLAPKSVPTPAQILQERLTHARALAILGNFQSAINELMAVRTQTTDPVIRDIASIILLGVQIKTGAYGSASAMLQESFKARGKSSQNRNLYFSLTGQMLHSVRLRLDRYREFGMMTTDVSAPNELRVDLDGLRILLEQAVEQAQQINDEEGRSLDASALIEDAASLRMSLARDNSDHTNWQREVAEARVQLAAPGARKKSAFLADLRNSASASSTASKNLTSGAAFQPTNKSNPSAMINGNSSQRASVNAADVDGNNIAANNTINKASANDSVAKNSDLIKTDAAPAQTVAVGSLVERATQRVAPSYPSTARNAHVAGTVTVYLLVDEKGEVKDVQNATGPDLLRGAARDAARRWRFQPTYINGQPVRVSGFITFNFTL